MTQRQALLLMQLTPAMTFDSKPCSLRIHLGGKDGMSRLEVVGPDGETLIFTPDEIMKALR